MADTGAPGGGGNNNEGGGADKGSNDGKGGDASAAPSSSNASAANELDALESDATWGDSLGANNIDLMSTNDIKTAILLLENDIQVMKSTINQLQHQMNTQKTKIKENRDKIKLNKTLPWLVASVVEVLEIEGNDDDEDEDESTMEKTSTRYGAVIKTSTRQTVYLPVIGLVEPKDLSPGDLVGVHKDSYLILEKLPDEYDSRVMAMELDEKPKEEFSDIGGCDKQIKELLEAVVLPMTRSDMFVNLGITPPKGVLLHGPPGTGKTLLARACANHTKAIFIKLAGPQLVQMYIGDGAKLVRDAFKLAKEKIKEKGAAGAIIFIDELDAIGTKRYDNGKSGDREVQRTMLELLNQLDGFTSVEKIKVIAASNRPDILDPALLRSGRLDRKIELPLPTERGRKIILQIHSRKMNVDQNAVIFDEIARSTEDFNGAQVKAVCVEAGMLALRRDSDSISHEDFMEGIRQVQMKKKASLQYYA